MKYQDDPKLREILQQAAELPSQKRSAFLDSACNGNAELRSEVESLLGHLEQEDSLLREVTVRPGALRADLPQGVSPPPSSEGPGGRIGRYKLLQLIGEGGFGTVFMAEQEHPVRRRVALKIIKLGMDTKQVIARFEAERQALAMMDHPNIAKVLDAGSTDSGRPYFVMELVKGVPITEYCDTNKLATKERIELFIAVCNAVQHAHQKGVIHRDLKPGNVLVTLHDGKPVPKIIDFGIAKATNQRLTEKTLFTEYRQFIGTPAYTSPEQAEMSGLDVDTRSDIYSLGVLLYELLTGATPFDSKKLREAAYGEVQRMIREVEPPRPSVRLSTMGEALTVAAKHRSVDPLQLRKQLRGDLDWIIMKCLEKDRTRRYETVNGVAADLLRHLTDEPVAAGPPATSYKLRKLIRKHKREATAVFAVAAALVLGLALATYGLVRARAERNRADRARIDAQSEKAIAEQQRQLAVANARQADSSANEARKSARDAKLELAQGFISQADALSLAGRFAEAHQLYTSAYDRLSELKEPPFTAELGLWSSYHQASFPVLSFTGHTDQVWGVAIAPDGRTALSASDDHTLKLWDLASGKELRTFTGHTNQVNSVAISPDGRTALSGSVDKTLKLWDLASGEVLRTFAGHTDQVNSVTISRDGRTALSGSADKTLKLWDLVSGKELRTFTGHTLAVDIVAISPDGRTALSTSWDMTLKLWDLTSGKELRAFTGHTNRVVSVAISPDGRTATSGSDDGTLRVWDLASGKELRTLTGHTSSVRSVAISPDGRTAISGSDDKTLRLWDLASGKELRIFAGHTGSATCVAISPDGRTALSGSEDKTLKLWDLAGGKELPFTGHTSPVLSVVISPDGRTALSGSADQTLKLWDLASGKELRTFTGHTSIVYTVAFAPDGRTVLSGSSDKTLRLWDLGSGKELRTFSGHTDIVGGVAISPDGRTALSSSWDKTLKLWDLTSGKELRTFTGHADIVGGVAISPDGRTALSGSRDKTLKLWDLASGKELRTFTDTAAVIRVAISPDGRTGLSGGGDYTLKLWDLASGNELRTFTGHTRPVASVAISPDGRTALSGSLDNTLKLWDLANGKELRTFTGHTSVVWSVAISPDGQSALSGSADETLKLWDFARGPAQRAFESRVTAAQARLQKAPSDPSALATLGEWFAFRGMDERAIDFLGRAREGGAAVAPLMLARCYWRLGRLVEARREFQAALEQSNDASGRNYLAWCIAAIDTEADSRRPNQTINLASSTQPVESK